MSKNGLLLLMAMAFMTLIGASAPLKPLVVRTANVQGGIPSDCDQSLSNVPQTARINVAELPATDVSTVALAPPSRELRAELDALQRALTRNDRPAFDEHLDNAGHLIVGYPPGAEKRAGEELVRIYSDTAQIWDAQFASPFFDETSAEYDILAHYPGYAEAVRRGMLTDDRDRRFYPAAESRTFLTRVAAERLARIGISAPRVPVTRSAASRPPRVDTQREMAQPAPTRHRVETPRVESVKREKSVAPKRTHIARASAPAKHTSPALTSIPVPVATTTHASPPPVTTTMPAPMTSSSSTTAPPVTAPPPPPIDTAPDTAITATTASTSVAPTTSSASAPTTSSAPEPAPAAAAPRRSMILPVILILIGLGVLVLLFRAST
jgi:hypothetical protein